jgi:glycosyltransferase involved in cell wall biosynthesis
MSSERLRVLIVGPFPRDPEKVIGGVQAANCAIATALSEHPQVEKVLVASLHTGEPREVQHINAKLEVQPVRLPFETAEILTRSALPTAKVAKLAKAFKPHVAHGQGIDREGMVATQLGLPSIVTVHGLVHVEAQMRAKGLKGKIKQPLYEGMVRQVLKAADVTISISDYDAKLLGPWIRGTRVNIPNGVPERFFAAAASEPRGSEVLFAGVMRPRKNVKGLVEAFAAVRHSVPAARLVIAGPAPDAGYQQEVLQRVKALDLEDAVTFMGHVTNDELIAAIGRSSALALFSREETLPTIIAQAMAASRPVVASTVGGIPGMIQDGKTGYLVASEDEGGLAQRLIAVLAEPERARQMGARGAALARDSYSASAVAERTLEAYALARQVRGRRG